MTKPRIIQEELVICEDSFLRRFLHGFVVEVNSGALEGFEWVENIHDAYRFRDSESLTNALVQILDIHRGECPIPEDFIVCRIKLTAPNRKTQTLPKPYESKKIALGVAAEIEPLATYITEAKLKWMDDGT